jgi:hypothetical protein
MKSTITSRSTQVSIYIPHPKLFASCNYFERNTNGDLSWPFFFFFFSLVFRGGQAVERILALFVKLLLAARNKIVRILT